MGSLKHKDHRKFVETEGWEKKGTARGKGKTGDHHRYTLKLADGTVLATRVSHGSGSIDDPGLVARILKDQLAVSEEDFYLCVKKGKLPPRPTAPSASVPETGLDAKLVRNLIRRAGLPEAEVLAMTKHEAVEAWQKHLASGPQD
jgi:hypothetical protein